MADKSYKIAFVPCDAFGHTNACLGMAKNLRERGHNCVFIANQNWKDLITKYGFENHIYFDEYKVETTETEGFWNQMVIKYAHTIKLPPFDKIKQYEKHIITEATQDVMRFNGYIKKELDHIRPDAIVVDAPVSLPAVITAGVPWIDLVSMAPLYYSTNENLPPAGSGYPSNGDKTLWKAFWDEVIDAYSEDWKIFNAWMQSLGAPPLPYKIKFHMESPFLNLHLWPKELSFDEMIDSKTIMIDSLIREDTDENKFDIPEQLRQLPGKLVYLSMGTLCSSDLDLMKRLITILSKSKHKFIISKGPVGEQLQLANNMWGQNSVPQLKVLPLVDLVITHGGNNTVTESLYFGRPMIVLPVLEDQYDNAQRVEETGLGLRLDPYFCKETELLEAIEKLVNDSELTKRYRQISKRMQESKSREIAAKLVEDVITQWKCEQNQLNK